MRFRVTLFWEEDDYKNEDKSDSTTSNKCDNDINDIWVMEGRQKALLTPIHHENRTTKDLIDVPPVSIMNAVEFETVDTPAITMLDAHDNDVSSQRSFRWTCMYSAVLFQGDHMSVSNFPHDKHHIKLKLGILAHRSKGGRWDHTIHKLALATENDSKGSTRIPHGLIIDHCHIPDFSFTPSDLRFQFLPSTYGGRCRKPSIREEERDVFLQVTLPVYRQSGHYDTSILPILVMLNIVAISCLARNFGSASASTELMLGIAFVQVGIRLTLDSRLPSVGYQIKMQKVMNCCFWLLCGLVLESNMIFFLVKKRGWDTDTTDQLDLAAGCLALVYNFYIIITYFQGRR